MIWQFGTCNLAMNNVWEYIVFITVPGKVYDPASASINWHPPGSNLGFVLAWKKFNLQCKKNLFNPPQCPRHCSENVQVKWGCDICIQPGTCDFSGIAEYYCEGRGGLGKGKGKELALWVHKGGFGPLRPMVMCKSLHHYLVHLGNMMRIWDTWWATKGSDDTNFHSLKVCWQNSQICTFWRWVWQELTGAYAYSWLGRQLVPNWSSYLPKFLHMYFDSNKSQIFLNPTHPGMPLHHVCLIGPNWMTWTSYRLQNTLVHLSMLHLYPHHHHEWLPQLWGSSMAVPQDWNHLKCNECACSWIDINLELFSPRIHWPFERLK